jgi:hypothetical protein
MAMLSALVTRVAVCAESVDQPTTRGRRGFQRKDND